MADFCRQCSIEMFGEDMKDLAGLTTEADTAAKMVAHVICEGCGHTYVDHTGKCVSNNCLIPAHQTPDPVPPC